MNIIDVLIILIIIGCTFMGFKRGFTKELVCFLGFFVVVILSFLLKDSLANLMYQYLPFFNFEGIFKGITSLNILLYEVIAFFIILSVLIIVLRIVLFVTSVFEKLLKLTIILGLPSKLLGSFVGFIQGLVWSFIICYIISLPILNNQDINNSNFRKYILNKTPIFKTFTSETVNLMDEISTLKDEYQNNDEMTSDQFNLKTLDLMLKYKVISIGSVDKLQAKGKLNIKSIDTVLKKYR